MDVVLVVGTVVDVGTTPIEMILSQVYPKRDSGRKQPEESIIKIRNSRAYFMVNN